jgi:ketosteroid isomerase-like protein
MSQENVDAFRVGFEDFNRAVTDGTDEYFEGLDEEIEFIPITAFLDGVTYRGKDGVRRWMDDLRRDWEMYEITIEELRDLDEDRVLAIGSWHARGRRSGVELRLQQAAWLAHYRNRKLLRLQTFTDRTEALEAAASSE